MTVATRFVPYRGLAPFGDSELDALLFFGRERETEIVTANVIGSRLTVLYGSSGVGNPLHLTMEMLKHATGIDIVAVPFRGDAQINTALIAGEVDIVEHLQGAEPAAQRVAKALQPQPPAILDARGPGLRPAGSPEQHQEDPLIEGKASRGDATDVTARPSLHGGGE